MIVERRYHRVKSGKHRELVELEKKWDAFEERLGGFPPKRRYWTYIGTHDPYMFVWEREWESLAAMEAANEKYQANAESHNTLRSLATENAELVEWGPHELYRLWSEDT